MMFSRFPLPLVRPLAVAVLAVAGVVRLSAQAADDYSTLQREAAQRYSERSYSLAHEAWEKASRLAVPAADQATLAFYLADSLWRSRPASERVAEARAALEKIADSDDGLGAEAAESLGDSWLALEQNWSQAWGFYRRALAFWAASSDLERARARYLGIVWKATGPPTEDHGGRRVPLEVLANARDIAVDADARARASFFLARWYAGSGDAFAQQRVGGELRAAVDAGRATAVYEPALFALAEWTANFGAATWQPGGQLVLGPDYDGALELFRRFAREFPPGKSANAELAQQRIDELTRVDLSLDVSAQFLPGVAPRFTAAWRNVGEVRFTLARVDPAKDFRPTPQTDPSRWIDALRLTPSQTVRQWTEVQVAGARRAPRRKEITLDPINEPGLYVIEAQAGAARARAVLVVTEAAAALRPFGREAVVFLCDARTGDRASAATAILWRAARQDDEWRWSRVGEAPATEGLVRFAWKGNRRSGNSLLLFGLVGRQPAVATSFAEGGDEARPWQVQVFTDRAAYRPGETVRWKLIARERRAGALTTPAGGVLGFEIRDPRGDVVRKGEVKLTEFGGAWGEFAPATDGVLGEYTIAFTRDGVGVGDATLFRLEEYRLPEFRVRVEPRSVGVRLGDEIPVKVEASFYFGGPVTDAAVTIEVTRSDYERPFPIAGGEESRPFPPRAGYRVVQRETRRTGPDGAVEFRLRTPLDATGDQRFSITARVVDASGREVVGEANVVVGRQAYFATVVPSRRVARPGDALEIAIATKDGNDRAVEADGLLTVTRQRWTEVWRDPQGREVSGEALDRLKRGVFPPGGEAGWRLVKQEYTSEEITRAEVATDAAGRATFAFKPTESGFYRVAWSGRDGNGPPVVAEANVWVSTATGGVIAYRSGGVNVIVDPTVSARAGRVPVLISTDTSNRDVCLLVHAGGEVYRAEVVHLDGDARLVELERDERFVPNVFVTAAAVRGLEFFEDTQEMAFPPLANTLQVELAADPSELAPGAEGTVRLAVRDAAGAPVRGEFAVAVTDEAVSAIQRDYAGDPVEFFFGQKRPPGPPVASSLAERPFYREPDPSLAVRRSGAAEWAATSDAFGAVVGLRSFAGVATTAKDEAMSPPTMAPLAKAAGEPAVRVRVDFSATAFWKPGLVTDADGVGSVRVRFPDSLTTWRIVARGASAGAQFGLAEATARTTQPLIARIAAPRFLVAGDKFTLTGVLNNRTDRPLDVRANLRIEGLPGAPKAQDARVAPGGDARVGWSLAVADAGRARFTLDAEAGALRDAVQAEVPVVPGGIERFESVAGKAGGAETRWTIRLPGERRAGSESLTVVATSSLAATALDALPYLITYPYGCVEQTMSRFLPAVVTARTLETLGLDRGEIARRIYGGVEREYLAQTHPPDSREAGLAELDAAVQRGLARLMELQRADGSWGWWQGDTSDPFMTAYVVWGLRLAQQSGVAVRSDLLARATDWLRQNLVNAGGDLDLEAWMLHAVAGMSRPGGRMAPGERASVDRLWARRDELSAYGRALFALAVHQYGDKDKAATLARNLRDGVSREAQPGVSSATGVGQPAANAMPTAHWGSAGLFRRWQDGGVEATAFALQALLAIDPGSDLVEPAMNWLVKNRRGAQWSNTRDTAITVLAMNRYLATTRELEKPVSLEVLVNGRVAGAARDATALAGVSRFVVDRALLRDGDNEIVLRRTAGSTPIYLAAQAQFFSLEDPIPAAGNELFVRRDYFRFAARQTLLDGFRFDRVAWAADAASPTDQRVEAELTLDAKNDLEYVLIEDLKPAGLETLGAKSGEGAELVAADGRRLPVYRELRDRKVAFFIRRLPQGTWTLRYELRTETPGEFRALPTLGQAMYAPEIRANGESRRVRIE